MQQNNQTPPLFGDGKGSYRVQIVGNSGKYNFQTSQFVRLVPLSLIGFPFGNVDSGAGKVSEIV